MRAVGSDGGRYQVGADTAGSRGVQITTGAANTKGSYTTLLTTSFDASRLIITLSRSSSSGDYLVDIALDLGGGTFQIIANNLLMSPFDLNASALYDLPFEIPAGSVIAARAQASPAAGSSTLGISAMIVESGLGVSSPYSGLLTMGANTADSGGTSVDPGASQNVKGAWVELDPSVDRTLFGLILAFGQQLNNARANLFHLFDIGIGAAGSEQVILDNIPITQSTNDPILPLTTPIFWMSIPEGSRLAARQQANTADATDRLADIIAYGVY